MNEYPGLFVVGKCVLKRIYDCRHKGAERILMNIIKTTSFTPPSVIKLYLYVSVLSKPSSEGLSTL
jgi:hypothetical protein